jgi:SAM-dependent methyltransferase
MKLLYEQKQLPIFQNRMYETEAAAKACPKGDMQLVEDQQTGLVFNAAFQSGLMEYDAQYQNEQAFSPLFQEHLESVSQIIDRCIGREAIVEVGCGKGAFLEMLAGKGFSVTGFDPTYEGNNPKVLKRYFQKGVGITANGLVLRHVLEHIQDPYNFLLELLEANSGSGKIYIEVPCFDWICEQRAWFDIFYEHVNYFRISDFYRMFDSVIEIGRSFGGQYLYVVAELSKLKKPKINPADRVSFPENFTNLIAQPCKSYSDQVAIWGGASKGVIFALLKERCFQPITTVIDINPSKQGTYLAGTGLLVQSPQDALRKMTPGATIYIMNSNYSNEIKQMSGNIFNYIEVDNE